ncbi:hypothetical protein [Phenylobacterium sp.]|jgi:hypothetical protein|uniref:hypothetical protein n=1 Tax=Phenylobacterium sp. TaxID=1871053 RepID=UPI003D2A9931
MTAGTLFAIALGLFAVAGFAGWRGARPPNPMKGPRMIPWRPIMVLCATAAILCVASAERMAGIVPPGR